MLELLSQMRVPDDTISIGWGQILLVLATLVATLGGGLVWAMKRAMGQVTEQQKQTATQSKALLEQMDRHHDDREVRAKEQHAEHLRDHTAIIKAIAESQAAMLGAFKELMAEVGSRRDQDKGMHAMLFRLASIVSFNKAKEMNCPESFMAFLDYAVKGDADSARREFAHAHAPNT